jgi:hypothetical protein
MSTTSPSPTPRGERTAKSASDVTTVRIDASGVAFGARKRKSLSAPHSSASKCGTTT